MSRVLLAIAIDDFMDGPQGAKEAAAMALEGLGRVQVLRVKIQEEEQLRMEEKQVCPRNAAVRYMSHCQGCS